MPEHDRGELRRRDAGQIGVHQHRLPGPLAPVMTTKPWRAAILRQRVQRRLMPRTDKEQGRIRGEGERRTCKTIKIEIHIHTHLSVPCCRERHRQPP